MVNIVTIPKPNKDTDKGSSYSPISLISVIAKPLEKSLLPYITANIPNTPMQHGYKTQHSTVTDLHTLNNTVAKGFNQMAPPARTNTVALDMSKAFDTINIHTLIRQTCYRQTFQAQSLSSSQTTSRDTKPKLHIEITHPNNVNLKLAFHKVASFHPHYLTFTPQCTGSGHGLCRRHHNHLHTHKYQCSQEIHTTIPTQSFAWTKQNTLLLNPDKRTCTLFTPDPAEYTSNLDLTINNKALPMATHPKVLGLTLDPKLTYSTHIHNISVQAHKPLQIIKALTATEGDTHGYL